MEESLRQLVFWIKGNDCVLCNCKAVIVHHIDYKTGDDINKLYPLCKGCHFFLHFKDNGYFRDMDDTTQRMQDLLALPTDIRFQVCSIGKKQQAARGIKRQKPRAENIADIKARGENG